MAQQENGGLAKMRWALGSITRIIVILYNSRTNNTKLLKEKLFDCC